MLDNEVKKRMREENFGQQLLNKRITLFLEQLLSHSLASNKPSFSALVSHSNTHCDIISMQFTRTNTPVVPECRKRQANSFLFIHSSVQFLPLDRLLSFHTCTFSFWSRVQKSASETATLFLSIFSSMISSKGENPF